LFQNFGTVIGMDDDTSATLFGINGENVHVFNFGKIVGASRAVRFDSEHTGGTLNNSGYIEVGSRHGPADGGVYIDTIEGLTTTINNAAAGIIRGVDHTFAVRSDAGQFVINNLGHIVGDIIDDAGGHDVVMNRGIIAGQVHLGDGNDVFNGAGGQSGK